MFVVHAQVLAVYNPFTKLINGRDRTIVCVVVVVSGPSGNSFLLALQFQSRSLPQRFCNMPRVCWGDKNSPVALLPPKPLELTKAPGLAAGSISTCCKGQVAHLDERHRRYDRWW